MVATLLYCIALALFKTARVVRAFCAKVVDIVSDRAADRVANLVIQASGDWLSRTLRHGKFDRAYRRYVHELCRLADQSGLPSIAPRALDLDDVFVDVSLVERGPQQMPSGVVGAEPEAGVRRQVWDFLDERRGPARLAIIGVPGSGKSTLLRHIALHPVGLSRQRRLRTLPVILQIRECAEEITSDQAPRLPTLIANRLSRLPISPSSSWFEKQLSEGRCIVMLDGLDEVASRQGRQAVVAWVTEQMTFYPGNDYLMTSRLVGYRENPLDRADQLQIREFTPEQVRRFVRGWYQATGRSPAAGNDSEAAAAIASGNAEAEDLIGRLEDNAALNDLAVNPLLLTMIAIVHRFNAGKLPDTRAELYSQMCEVLLERPPHAKPLPEPLLPGQKEAVLGDLAFTMTSNGTLDVGAAEAIKSVGRSLAPTSSLSPASFLGNACANGILVASAHSGYSFAHPTFQEYLAAAAITDEARTATLVQNIGNSWWRETILLYAALAGAGVVVAAALASGQLAPLTVAIECADADPHLDRVLRERLNELLVDADKPDASAERRRLAAALIATRELRKTIRLADGTRVCATPVSRRLFEIFTCQTADEFPVDHPAATQCVEDGEPAVGITGNSATAFVAWVNDLLNADTGYRLPGLAETLDPRFTGNPFVEGRCVWLAADGEPPGLTLWCAPQTLQPFEVSATTLRDRLVADAAGPLAAPLAMVLSFALAHALATADMIIRAHSLGRAKGRLDLPVQLRSELERVKELCLDMATALDAAGPRRRAPTSRLNGALARTGSPAFAADLTGGMISGNLAAELAQARAHELAAALRVTLSHVDGREFTMHVARPGGRSTDSASRPNRAFNQAADRNLELACNDLTGGLNLSPPVLSRLDIAFCALFSRCTAPVRGPRESLDLICGPALQDMIAPPAHRTIMPDQLRPLATDGLAKIGTITADPGQEHLQRRITSMAAKIDRLVTDLDTSDPAFLSAVVPIIRFGAIAIAAGSIRLDLDPGVIARYVDIAAGITAIEQRATGNVAPSEVIVLVRV